jgi:transcriptional regulator with XRE-family HTH domain
VGVEPAPFADVGTIIKELRESRSLSQSKLAERCDFDHSYISRLESGVRNPTRDALERISIHLGLVPKEDRRLMNAGGFLALSDAEHDEFDDLRELLDNPLIRPDVRDAMRTILGAAKLTLEAEASANYHRTGGGTVTRSETKDGVYRVVVEQPL